MYMSSGVGINLPCRVANLSWSCYMFWHNSSCCCVLAGACAPSQLLPCMPDFRVVQPTVTCLPAPGLAKQCGTQFRLSKMLARGISAPLVAAVAVSNSKLWKRQQVHCQPEVNRICTAVQTASSAVQGLAALEQLCERCKQGQQQFGSDPCAELSSDMLKQTAAGDRTRFKRLELAFLQISAGIKAAIEAAGEDVDRNQVLGSTLRVVNHNLQMLRQLKLADLNFDPSILESGLLQHHDFFSQAAQKLEMSFLARGHNHRNALQMTVHNPSNEEVKLVLPAGALFQPTKRKDSQGLVLRDATTVCVKPRGTKTISLWAFCANSNKASPHDDLQATDYVLKCDLSSQSSVWAKTSKFER